MIHLVTATNFNGALAQRAEADGRVVARKRAFDGVDVAIFERSDERGLRMTCQVSMAPGAHLELDGGRAYDIYVIYGAVTEASAARPGQRERHHRARTFVGLPRGEARRLTADGGAELFVKVRPSSRRVPVVVDTSTGTWESSHTPGFWIMRLDEQPDGRVVLLRFDPGTELGPHRHEGGEEFFVLDGVLQDDGGSFAEYAWVRQPVDSVHSVRTTTGCLMLTTAGHLSEGGG